MLFYVLLCFSNGFPAKNHLKTTPASQVLAAEGFGGQGGGQSAWPPLLKRQLLGAKDEPEVAATQAWLGHLGGPWVEVVFWKGWKDGTSFSALDVFRSFAHFGFCFLGVGIGGGCDF